MARMGRVLVAWALALAPLTLHLRPGPLEGVLAARHSALPHMERFGWAFLLLATAAVVVLCARRPSRWWVVALVAAVALLWLSTWQGMVFLLAVVVLPAAYWSMAVDVPGSQRLDPMRRRALVSLAPIVIGVQIDWMVSGTVSRLAIATVALLLSALMITARNRVAFGLSEAVAGVGEILEPVIKWLRGPLGRAGRLSSGSSRSVRSRLAPGWQWFVEPTGAPPTPEKDRSGGGWRALGTEYRWPVMAWFVVHYLVSRLMVFSSNRWGGHPTDWPYLVMPSTSDTTGRLGWGTGDYWLIASEGYESAPGLHAAFPGLALVLRALRVPFGTVAEAGVVLITASGLACVLLLWAWMRGRGYDRRERKVAVGLLLLYPYCFLMAGVAYSDVLLLALLLGVFLLSDSNRPVLAGVVVAAATATRPNALPIIAGLVVAEMARARVVERTPVEQSVVGGARHNISASLSGFSVHLSRLRPRQAGVLLSVGGVASYSAWLYASTGDPLRFLTAQEHFGHTPVTWLSTWFKVGFVNNPRAFIQHWLEVVNEVLALSFLVIALALLPTIFRRFGAGHGVFAGGVIAIAWVGPQGFAPGGRLLLPMLPLAVAAVAPWLARRPRVLVPVLVLLSLPMLFLAAMFPSGVWGEW